MDAAIYRAWKSLHKIHNKQIFENKSKTTYKLTRLV